MLLAVATVTLPAPVCTKSICVPILNGTDVLDGTNKVIALTFDNVINAPLSVITKL